MWTTRRGFKQLDDESAITGLIKAFEANRLPGDREYKIQCSWRADRLYSSGSYRCFMRTEMDYLVLENFVLSKESQKTHDD